MQIKLTDRTKEPQKGNERGAGLASTSVNKNSDGDRGEKIPGKNPLRRFWVANKFRLKSNNVKFGDKEIKF